MAFGQLIDQRKQNKRNHVVDLFRENGALSKARARQLSGYSMDTLITLFKTLEDEGYIEPVRDQGEEKAAAAPAETRSKGRPAELYQLVPVKELYLGITFNQTGIWATLVGLDGRELVTSYAELPNLAEQTGFERFFRSHVAGFLDANRSRVPAIRQVALALPGRIDAERGILLRYPLMPCLADLDLVAPVRELVGDIPVSVQHNIAGFAAALLRDPDARDLGRRILYVSARSGTAHALIQDGKLVIDDGEMGHLAVPCLDRSCQCGRTGCLDTIFSAAAFHELFPGQGWTEIAQAIARDDPQGRQYRERLEPSFQALVDVLLNLSAAFSPDALVLSGELFACMPEAESWIAGHLRSRYGQGKLPGWVPGTIRYLPGGVVGAAVGLCRSLMDMDWAWQAD